MNTKTTYLYCLNFPNGKKYIGKSDHPKSRLVAHINAARRGTSLIHAAIREHGVPRLQILCVGDEDYILTLEVVAIEYFRTQNKIFGYNAARGGQGGSYKKNVDITDQQFGKLTAIRRTEERHGSHKKWLCACDCGGTILVTMSNLQSGNTASCGCSYGRDITGQRFGRLVAIKRTDERSTNHVKWLCTCDCGCVTTVTANSLYTGNTRSCGCLLRDTATTHGKTHSPEFKSWQGMRQRCSNPKAPSYKNFGGKGITICKRWDHSFEAFYADMGPRPSPKHTLARIDSNKGFYKENCHWASR